MQTESRHQRTQREGSGETRRRYEDKTSFDEVAWGSHCVDCYPGSCPYRVYVKDGKIRREEVAGTFPQFEPGVPDMNPLGCQKGNSWSQQIDAADRLLHPMRRVGERGSGQWERITWDEALTEVADAVIDAIEEVGTESVVHEGTPEVAVVPATSRFMGLIGGIQTDVNGSINDFAAGHHLTFGRFYPIFSNDDLFHTELLLLWHVNPAYTCIPFYHYMCEMRYKGGEVVLFAPDVSPSHTHVDYHVPVEYGSDAALALSMCQVILQEDLVDEDFVASQTDLSLLVRTDTERFLRQADLVEGGHDEVFYHWHPERGPLEASRSQLLLDFAPRLEGTTTVTLADGATVEVRPLMVRLRAMLDAEYRPEQTQATTGVHPDTIRTLARKAASRRTTIVMGMGGCKAYHSDLFQRTMDLLLGLTGNWGKKGTGTNCWAVGLFDGQVTTMAKQRAGIEGAEDVLGALDAIEGALKAADPTLSDELATIETWRNIGALRFGGMAPSFFFWYWHCGFRERWNNPTWNDPGMARSFDEYFDEAIEEGWWQTTARPGPESPPRVMIECGGNRLRRTRGGQGALMKSLWPQLKLIVDVDFRMSITALHSDILLPAAQHYEKVAFHIPSPSMLTLTLCDKAAEPVGEAKEEWEIFSLLCEKLAERAAARGRETFSLGARRSLGADDGVGVGDAAVVTRRYADLWSLFTLNGALLDSEDVGDEMIRDTVHSGTLPAGTDIKTLREDGWVRFQDWGIMPMAAGQSSPWPEKETHAPFRNHVEKGYPYPTLTRRAQFLIEHPWYVEAGEDLPVHKDPPLMGGDRPFRMSTGHNRWSIHAMNMCNPVLIQTHRGEPSVVMNDADAARLGVGDGDRVRVHNDVGEFLPLVKISPGQRPGGLMVYNGWEGFMFKGWKGSNECEPGMVKWLQMAGGYGHLRYAAMEWQPVPVDRAIFVDVEPAPD